jgi:hypothetical protein
MTWGRNIVRMSRVCEARVREWRNVGTKFGTDVVTETISRARSRDMDRVIKNGHYKVYFLFLIKYYRLFFLSLLKKDLFFRGMDL